MAVLPRALPIPAMKDMKINSMIDRTETCAVTTAPLRSAGRKMRNSEKVAADRPTRNAISADTMATRFMRIPHRATIWPGLLRGRETKVSAAAKFGCGADRKLVGCHTVLFHDRYVFGRTNEIGHRLIEGGDKFRVILAEGECSV